MCTSTIILEYLRYFNYLEYFNYFFVDIMHPQNVIINIFRVIFMVLYNIKIDFPELNKLPSCLSVYLSSCPFNKAHTQHHAVTSKRHRCGQFSNRKWLPVRYMWAWYLWSRRHWKCSRTCQLDALEICERERKCENISTIWMLSGTNVIGNHKHYVNREDIWHLHSWTSKKYWNVLYKIYITFTKDIFCFNSHIFI